MTLSIITLEGSSDITRCHSMRRVWRAIHLDRMWSAYCVLTLILAYFTSNCSHQLAYMTGDIYRSHRCHIKQTPGLLYAFAL